MYEVIGQTIWFLILLCASQVVSFGLLKEFSNV